jgi:hypothetical protein
VELAEVTLTPLQRRNRAAFLKHSDLVRQQTDVGRDVHSLSPGEQVVLHADDGEYFAGRVIETLLAQGEETYLISVGVRLPQEWALLRVGHKVPRQPTRTSDAQEQTQELLDLLGAVTVSYVGLPKQSTGGRTPRRRARR